MRHDVVIFIDYQNAYEGARATFFSGNDFHTKGQFDPLRLGMAICARQVSRIPRQLKQVRIYTGLPASSRDSKGYGARMRQIAAWEKLGPVDVYKRVLRYPRQWPQEKAQEKGIDVQLAIDFVMMKIRDDFDVGLIFSTDTDLLPALEAVCGLTDVTRGGCLPEVCTWGEPKSGRSRLRVPAFDLRCHWLGHKDYVAIADNTDYNVRPGTPI